MQTEYSKVYNLQRCEELMQINCQGETGGSCHKTEQSHLLGFESNLSCFL